MRRWMIGLGAAGALAGAAAFAGGTMAQGFGGQGPGDPRFGGRGAEGRGFGRPAMSPEDVSAFADARIAALHAGLRLTADQEKLWPPVEDAIRGLARQRQEARQARRERFAALRDQADRNIPDMLRFMADRRTASAEALRKLADASAPLYAALDQGQKRRMAMLARGLARMGGERMGDPETLDPGTGGPGRWRRGETDGPGFGGPGPTRRGDAGFGPRDFAGREPAPAR